MIQKRVWLLIFSAVLVITASSCNHNKIACPAYADSAPEKSKSSKPEAPKALPKGGSHVSHSMGPGGK